MVRWRLWHHFVHLTWTLISMEILCVTGLSVLHPGLLWLFKALFFMTFTFYRLTPLVLRTAKTPRPPPKNIKGFSKSQKTQISLSAKSGSCNNVKTNGPLMMKLGEWTDRLFSGDYTHLFYFVHWTRISSLTK